MENYNKTLAKKLERLTIKQLVIVFQSFKNLNRTRGQTMSFQRNYNSVINEMKKRRLM